MTEDNNVSYPSGIQMLTAESSSVELYQELCKVVEELEECKNKAYNYEQGYHIQSLRADEAEKKAERYRLDANKEMAKRMYWEKDNKLPKPFDS